MMLAALLQARPQKKTGRSSQKTGRKKSIFGAAARESEPSGCVFYTTTYDLAPAVTLAFTSFCLLLLDSKVTGG